MAVETEFPGGTVPTSNAKWQFFATGRTLWSGRGGGPLRERRWTHLRMMTSACGFASMYVDRRRPPPFRWSRPGGAGTGGRPATTGPRIRCARRGRLPGHGRERRLGRTAGAHSDRAEKPTTRCRSDHRRSGCRTTAEAFPSKECHDRKFRGLPGPHEIDTRIGYIKLGVDLRTAAPTRAAVPRVLPDPEIDADVAAIRAEFDPHQPAVIDSTMRDLTPATGTANQ